MDRTENYVYLNQVENVKKFIAAIGEVEGDINIEHGRYIIDARSIMGIFSIDLSNRLKVVLYSTDNKQIEKFNNICKEFEN